MSNRQRFLLGNGFWLNYASMTNTTFPVNADRALNQSRYCYQPTWATTYTSCGQTYGNAVVAFGIARLCTSQVRDEGILGGKLVLQLRWSRG